MPASKPPASWRSPRSAPAAKCRTSTACGSRGRLTRIWRPAISRNRIRPRSASASAGPRTARRRPACRRPSPSNRKHRSGRGFAGGEGLRLRRPLLLGRRLDLPGSDSRNRGHHHRSLPQTVRRGTRGPGTRLAPPLPGAPRLRLRDPGNPDRPGTTTDPGLVRRPPPGRGEPRLSPGRSLLHRGPLHGPLTVRCAPPAAPSGSARARHRASWKSFGTASRSVLRDSRRRTVEVTMC